MQTPAASATGIAADPDWLCQADCKEKTAFAAARMARLKPGRFGPAIADQFAAFAACHWRKLLRDGEADPREPLDIIDLCPTGSGETSLMIAALSRRLGSRPGLRCRYLPVFADREALPCVSAIPEQAHSAIEVDRLLWDLAAPENGPRLGAHLQPYQARNPVILLAHDAWSQLPQQLFAAHYGKLLRAELALSGAEDGSKTVALWENASLQDFGDALAPSIHQYLKEFNSAPLVLPKGAIRVISSALKFSGGRLLTVSVCKGQGDAAALRLASFADICSGYQRTGRLPLNSLLTAQWAQANQGVSEQRRLSSGEVLQLQLFGGTHPGPHLEMLARCIDPVLLACCHHLVETCRGLRPDAGLETRLHLLQASRYDPAVFAAQDRHIVVTMGKNGLEQRAEWRIAIERVWENYRMHPAGELLHRRIAAVAMHCAHWGLARAVLNQSLREQGANAEDLSNLAWCEARTGNLALGSELVARALSMDAGSQLAQEVDRRLMERRRIRDTQWRTELRHELLPLVLEPLDDSHAEAYFCQYRDPQIAVMTGLPAFSSLGEARQWISAQQGDTSRVNYAVMHRDWGFVGFVNLAVSAHAAFFCYWTGVDFQGRGLATAAGRLACAYAATQGVPVILTSAYKDNHRSIRGLERIGFRELVTRAQPPDQDRIFFSLVDQSAGEVDSDQELINYYAREKLPMEFITAAAWRMMLGDRSGQEESHGNH